MSRSDVFEAIRAARTDKRFSTDEVLKIDDFLDSIGVPRIGSAPAPTVKPNPRFPTDLILAAVEAQRQLGVPASVSLAQWALESGYGKSMPAGSNNPFGMKARANETGPVVTARTREVYTAGPKKGQEYFITTAFRKFDSVAAAFIEHARLVGTAKVYAPARAKLPDVDAYVDVLAPIYATDPKYAALIKSIMKSNDLYQYNEVKA